MKCTECGRPVVRDAAGCPYCCVCATRECGPPSDLGSGGPLLNMLLVLSSFGLCAGGPPLLRSVTGQG